MNHKLSNYLRTHRKRSGLSQSEVAFLLGSGTRTKVSRYERHRRLPCIETALAYEIIFQTSSRTLFEGVYRNVEIRTHNRVRELAEKLMAAPSSPTNKYKVAALARICSLEERGASPLSASHRGI